MCLFLMLAWDFQGKRLANRKLVSILSDCWLGNRHVRACVCVCVRVCVVANSMYIYDKVDNAICALAFSPGQGCPGIIALSVNLLDH